MKHIHKLFGGGWVPGDKVELLFLDGIPIDSKLKNIHVGSEIPIMYKNDHAAEVAAISGYNESIRVAMEIGDNGSRELFETILKKEEEHIDLIEAQM